MTQRTALARRTRIHRALRISCASAALAAAALAPQSAHAQALGAFRGTVTGTTGTVTRNPVSNTAETITIGSGTATINWSPSGQQQGGGTLDFLPAGNTASFTSAQGITDYTVLNRIVPDSGQPIALNGHVVSTLQGTSTTGGNVWFYSPNGIVVGSSAVFDVGSLLLTTNDVTSFGTKPDGFTATFSGPDSSTSAIQVQNGAQINALQQNSYVALVAPRIEQGGKVRVNGSAAYAAGEQLTMTMNQGLFDIQVDVGTSDYNGVVHTGETSGPANTSAAGNHKIYMVAVPKNQAMTMLLGGTVGFDDASSASVKNGEIVLSSGWGVHDSDDSGQVYTSTAGLDAGIDVGPGNYTSDVTGFGQSLIEASAENGNINFGGDLNLSSWSGVGYNEVSLIAGGDYQLNIAGAAHLSAAAASASAATGDVSGADNYGGDVNLDAYDGGSITTGGNLLIEAYGSGQSATGTGTGGSGYGGTVYMGADYGGSITVNGDLTANVNGVGGNAAGQAGDGQAGTFDLSIYGGNMAVGGDVNIWANGFGGNGLTAGNGFGGSASTDLESAEAGTGSGLSVTKDFSMQAAGQGGNGIDNPQGAGGQGGDGYGGNAWFYIDNYATDATVTFSAANAEVMANATGGNGGNGSTGGNGGVGSANGYYGGGDCTECYYVGSAQFELYGGTATVGDLLVYSTARGGNGGSGSDGAGGNGGAAYGGDSWADIGGKLTATHVLSYDRAFGGNGGVGLTQGNGGEAAGGYAGVDVSEGGQLTGDVEVATTAFGGAGNIGGSAGYIDGSGYGGSSWFDVEGTFNGGILIDSSATGGAGVVQGGNAWAGTSDLYIYGGAATATGIQLHADSLAGNASSGAGGYSYGGSASAGAYGGTLNGGDLTATANSTGGNGTSTAGGGEAGNVDLFAYDLSTDQTASVTLGNVSLTANGTSGAGPNDGTVNGGFGSIGVYASGASIRADTLTAQANGSSFGGQVNLTADIDYYGGSTSSLDFGSVSATANGGDNAGSVIVDAGNGSSVNLGNAELHADGAFGGEVALLTTNCDCGGGGGGLQTPRAAALTTAGGISASNLTLDTSGVIYTSLTAGAGIDVSGALTGNAGQYIQLYDDGTGGSISAQSIDLTSTTFDGNAHLVGDTVALTTAGYMNVGDVDASNSATFTAGSLATFNGIVSAPTITVTSGDIDIADGASLGVWGTTNLITLNAVSNGQPIIIGDNGVGGSFGQYVLNEDGDIHTNSLVINAIGDPPNVEIHDVTIEGSQTSGAPGASQVTLNTGGSVFVDGVVDFINAGATDSLTINAGQKIEVNTDTGGIQITDSAGKLAGKLALNAADVWVGSGSILGQLETNLHFSGRNDALGTNSGMANPDGFLRAGTINAGVTSSFLVQNSGTDVGAGIDLGDGELHITNIGSVPVTVVAFGRQSKSNGTVLTKMDFVRAVHLSGPAGFTADSMINSCDVATCGQTEPPPPPPPPSPPGTDTSSVLGPIDGTFTPGSIDFVDNTSDPNDPRDITDEQVLDQIEANAQGSPGGSNSGSNGSQSTGNSDSNGSQSAANSEDSQVKHDAAGQLAANSPDGDNEDNSADDGSTVDPSMRLINTTPVNLQQQIDDPVTSSGDTIVSTN